MAKGDFKYNIYCFIVLFLFTGFTIRGNGLNLDSVRNGLVSVAWEEVGTMETGGNNLGERVEQYQLSTPETGIGLAWCADFLRWCFDQINWPVKANAWSPSWFNEQTTKYIRAKLWGYVAKPGDVFGLYYSSLGRIGHVGFIIKINRQYFVTVEGNTTIAGTRESNRRDGVHKRYRPHWSVYKISNHINQ